MSRLGLAQQIAGAADLQVTHGNPVARPELRGLADGLEPLVGVLAEHAVHRVEQVGVGPSPGPAHPAPDLVQLTEAQPVGPVHHQGVDGGHVDARLDDGRAHQHVVPVVGEVEHDPLERALVHLAVGDRHPGLGDHAAHPRRGMLDVGHPIVDVEDLPLPQQLASDGLGHGPVGMLPDVGEDRLAIGGRGVQQRHVAYAGQAHLQRPRHRRSGEREHVHVGPHRLDGLLVADSESLLLIDDQQPQALEAHIG